VGSGVLDGDAVGLGDAVVVALGTGVALADAVAVGIAAAVVAPLLSVTAGVSVATMAICDAKGLGDSSALERRRH
jgi:hypothetical protein